MPQDASMCISELVEIRDLRSSKDLKECQSPSTHISLPAVLHHQPAGRACLLLRPAALPNLMRMLVLQLLCHRCYTGAIAHRSWPCCGNIMGKDTWLLAASTRHCPRPIQQGSLGKRHRNLSLKWEEATCVDTTTCTFQFCQMSFSPCWSCVCFFQL